MNVCGQYVKVSVKHRGGMILLAAQNCFPPCHWLGPHVSLERATTQVSPQFETLNWARSQGGGLGGLLATRPLPYSDVVISIMVNDYDNE